MPNSSLASNPDAIVYFTGVDLSEKEGYLYKYDATYGLAINDSATVPAAGVVLSGAPAVQQSSIAFLGATAGTYRLKSSGTIKRWQHVQQDTAGTVTVNAGSGARTLVGIADENAVSGDLFRCALISPIVIAS